MVSQIQRSVPSLSTEPAASASVPGAADNIFEEILQKAAQQNRQNSDAASGGILSANPDRGISSALSVNQPMDASAASTGDATQNPFVPTFQTDAQVINSFNGQVTDLNPMYFATSQTAQYLADKFGNGQVREEAPYGSGNPYYSSASQYYIQTPNGQWLNAGLLADYYQRMPEAQWPGLADQEIRTAIAQAGG
jgi:hypothetical protein